MRKIVDIHKVKLAPIGNSLGFILPSFLVKYFHIQSGLEFSIGVKRTKKKFYIILTALNGAKKR